MAIGIGIPNGVVNLPTVHMVQTFRGNYLLERTSYTRVQPENDLYFGSFFFSNDASGDIVKGTGYTMGRGAYDRGASDTGSNETAEYPLFPFDVDGVQGAIKAKGDEKWIVFRGMYANTIKFTSVAGNGFGADSTLSAGEKGFREGRGTWRYRMNQEAGMAGSIALSGLVGVDKAVSTINKKYTAGGVGVSHNKVSHKSGKFSVIGKEIEE